MIKRKLAFIFVTVFILCIISSAMAYSIMYVYTSNGKSLNLRDAPSSYGNIMTTIPYGTAVRVNDAFNPTWYSVTYNGYTGYAMSRYLVSSYIAYPSGYYPLIPTPTPITESDQATNIDINIDIGKSTDLESDADSESESDSDSDSELELSDSGSDDELNAQAKFLGEIFNGFKAIYYKAMVNPDNTAGYANLYWAPSLYSDIHGQYYANEVLTVMSQNSLWCQVLDEDGYVMGYMLRQFLTAYYFGDH